MNELLEDGEGYDLPPPIASAPTSVTYTKYHPTTGRVLGCGLKMAGTLPEPGEEHLEGVQCDHKTDYIDIPTKTVMKKTASGATLQPEPSIPGNTVSLAVLPENCEVEVESYGPVQVTDGALNMTTQSPGEYKAHLRDARLFEETFTFTADTEATTQSEGGPP